MAERNGSSFDKSELTERTRHIAELDQRQHKTEGRTLITWAAGIIGVVLSLIGAGWTAKTYIGHVATAAEVEKLKAEQAAVREDVATIKQARADDVEWRSELRKDVAEVKQQMKQMLDLMLGRVSRRSDGR